jgi:hypothetical protein
MKTLKNSKLVNARNGAIVAGAAVAAASAAWDRTHRHVTRADLTEAQMRVERLSDLRHEKGVIAAIDAGLVAEWGPFAFLGFESAAEMAAEAGDTIFVVVERDDDGPHARGIVQTLLADVHGDPELLEAAYPNFRALTARETWKASRHHGGDTAVLLQITTLSAATERGGGIGSLLRNAVLNMLPKSVKYALTTTPVDGTTYETVDFEDTSTYTPAMRFHARGGANPSHLLPGYKVPEDSDAESSHGRDVVMMRYERDEEGNWPAKRPPMRVRSLGPIEERLLRTGRRLRIRGVHAPRRLHLPAMHAPHVGLPHIHPATTLRALKSVGLRRHPDADAPVMAETQPVPPEPLAAEG